MTGARSVRAWAAWAAALGALAAPVGVAAAAEPAREAAEAREAEAEPGAAEVAPAPGSAADGYGYTPPAETLLEALKLSGYVDVGFAVAQGDGTSFAPGDDRLPADYGVDTFATAVNARGEVASAAAGGLYGNGFRPRSLGIGGRPSFLLNTMSADARFAPASLPFMVFVRLQVMPRFDPGGDATRVDLQQAFGKLTPFASEELTISVGKFDSVFGIEYLENEANLRVGVTPSLIARYTTGQGLGVKGFYRLQLPALWSALSLNAAATVGGTRVEALMNPHVSLTGAPVGSARLGYELNLQRLQVKLGVSGLYGPRNDQKDVAVTQRAIGADVRVTAFGLSVSAELIRLIDQEGTRPGKWTPLGEYLFASGFEVTGFYATLAWTLPLTTGWLDGITVYGRYDHRRARFFGFRWVEVNRVTAGGRIELFQHVALKAEYLVNGELVGAPEVANNVFTASAVFSW